MIISKELEDSAFQNATVIHFLHPVITNLGFGNSLGSFQVSQEMPQKSQSKTNSHFDFTPMMG